MFLTSKILSLHITFEPSHLVHPHHQLIQSEDGIKPSIQSKMQWLFVFHLMFIALFLFQSSWADIYLHSVHAVSNTTVKLVTGMKIVIHEHDVTSKVLCTGARSDKEAELKVNRDFHSIVSRPPFFMRGQAQGIPSHWLNNKDGTLLTCSLKPSNQIHEVTVFFTRTEAQLATIRKSKARQSKPGDLYFIPSGSASNASVQIKEGIHFCPEKAFGTRNFTIFCKASPKSKTAVFRINRRAVRRDFRTPYVISSTTCKNPIFIRPWRDARRGPFQISCHLDDGFFKVVKHVSVRCTERSSSSPDISEKKKGGSAPPPRTKLRFSKEQCVIIPAQRAKISNGWKIVSNGVTFKGDDDSINQSNAGLYPLHYNFTAPITSRYAVILDMTTTEKTEHNDVWLMMTPDGLQTIRDRSRIAKDGWIKGYQNRNGRAVITSHVDRDPHSISTVAVLKKGEEYGISISGRSTKVTVHRLLLFPCDGWNCQRSEWVDRQNRCIPGSM